MAEKKVAKSLASKAQAGKAKTVAKMPEKKVAKSPAPRANAGKAKAIAKVPVSEGTAKKAPARADAAVRTPRVKPVEARKSEPQASSNAKMMKPAKAMSAPAPKAAAKAFTLDEVRSFLSQHHEGKGIKLPGRTADEIATIHDAYNQSTYKYAESVLELLKKWANN